MLLTLKNTVKPLVENTMRFASIQQKKTEQQPTKKKKLNLLRRKRYMHENNVEYPSDKALGD